MCGYGARGSAKRSSPSSNIATRPRSATGANAAPRVPSTTRTRTAATARKARYRSAGFCDPVRTTCRPSPSTDVNVSCQRATSRTSGTHTMLPRPACRAWPGPPRRRLGRVVGRQRRPAGPRPLPGRQRGEECRPCGHDAQASSVTAGSGSSAAPDGCASARACRGGTAKPEDVAERAGPAIGDRAAQPEDGRRQHRLGRDDLAQERQLALVVAGLDAVDDERIGEAPGEPDPDAAAGHDVGVELAGTR